jgi:mRNA-degrading endonuclease RelE of RelBE toxin-antitoxin system
MEPFELLVHLEALETLRKIRGENRKQIRRFLSILPTNPYLQPDATFEDRKGRIVSKVRIRNYILEDIVDDPVREIILQIKFICLYHLAIVK